MKYTLLILAFFPAGIEVAAAQWTETPGKGWIQLSSYLHHTARRFDERGDIRSLFNAGGRSTTASVFVTGAFGLTKGIDAWAEIPFHHLSFDDVVAERTSTGFGDPRVFLRVGHERFGVDLGGWAAAVRGGVKFTLGSFPIDSEIIPLTEGQVDYEVLLEIGRSFWPTPVYAFIWGGHRWRTENEEARRRPGNERFVHVAAGGAIRNWTWKVLVEVLDGRPPELFSIEVASGRRELLQVLPSVGRRIGPGVLEVGVRVPVAGRNLPAGPAVFAAYFSRVNLSKLWD